MIILVFEYFDLVQLFGPLSDDLFLLANAHFFEVLESEAELFVEMRREEAGRVHVVLGPIVIPEPCVVLIFDRHFVNVVWLQELFHLGAPPNFLDNLLVTIEVVFCFEVASLSVSSVLRAALKSKHLFPIEQNRRIDGQVLQLLLRWRHCLLLIRPRLLGHRSVDVLWPPAVGYLLRSSGCHVLQAQVPFALVLVDHEWVQPDDVAVQGGGFHCFVLF